MNSCKRLLCMLAWLIVDFKAEGYKSGSTERYCFVISDISNSNEYFDQSTAQQFCRSYGIPLVEIKNVEIQNSLVNFISSVYSQGLNGSNFRTNGKRSSGNWLHLNGNSIGDITVYNQKEASFAYGYLQPTTSGFDLSASRTTYNKGFICSGLSDCSGGVTISGQCYKSFSETLSWYDARNRCLDAGGDLASFDHIATNEGFNALSGSWINASNNYWIGIRREWWTWQYSNSDVKYSDWITGHPRNELGDATTGCLCLSTSQWMWTECGCIQRLPFVCIAENYSTTYSTATRSDSTSPMPSTSPMCNSLASESSRDPSLIPTPAMTSRSTPSPIDAENTDKLKGLTCTMIGVAVGVGIGTPLIIVIGVLAVVIVGLEKERRRSLETNQTTSSKNQIQQPASGDTHELSGISGDPYESLQPKIERTATSDGLYQSLDLSAKPDSSVLASNF